MDYNEKFLSNLKDEIKRLNTQLLELEEYKEELPEEEYSSIKEQTINELINHKNLLDKLIHGDVNIRTQAELAQLEINKILCETYNVKELLNSYLSKEIHVLRQKLKQLKQQLDLDKISKKDYEIYVSEILSIIEKNGEVYSF